MGATPGRKRHRRSRGPKRRSSDAASQRNVGRWNAVSVDGSNGTPKMVPLFGGGRAAAYRHEHLAVKTAAANLPARQAARRAQAQAQTQRRHSCMAAYVAVAAVAAAAGRAWGQKEGPHLGDKGDSLARRTAAPGTAAVEVPERREPQRVLASLDCRGDSGRALTVALLASIAQAARVRRRGRVTGVGVVSCPCASPVTSLSAASVTPEAAALGEPASQRIGP